MNGEQSGFGYGKLRCFADSLDDQAVAGSEHIEHFEPGGHSWRSILSGNQLGFTVQAIIRIGNQGAGIGGAACFHLELRARYEQGSADVAPALNEQVVDVKASGHAGLDDAEVEGQRVVNQGVDGVQASVGNCKFRSAIDALNGQAAAGSKDVDHFVPGGHSRCGIFYCDEFSLPVEAVVAVGQQAARISGAGAVFDLELRAGHKQGSANIAPALNEQVVDVHAGGHAKLYDAEVKGCRVVHEGMNGEQSGFGYGKLRCFADSLDDQIAAGSEHVEHFEAGGHVRCILFCS